MSDTLTGFCFLVIVKNKLSAGGALLAKEDGNYLARFDGPANYSAMLGPEEVKQLTLFANPGERDDFAQAWIQNHPEEYPPVEEIVLEGLDADGNAISATPVNDDDADGETSNVIVLPPNDDDDSGAVLEQEDIDNPAVA